MFVARFHLQNTIVKSFLILTAMARKSGNFETEAALAIFQ
jgi:hypothetical protein